MQQQVQLTPQQTLHMALAWLRNRDRGRTDLYWLANEVLSPPDSRIMTRHAHGCMIDHCQQFKGRIELLGKKGELRFKNGVPVISHSVARVPMQELEGSRDNLLLVSRGHLKTTVHTIAHIIQWIINYPEVRILMCTSTDEKAQIIVGKIKYHFQFNPLFRFLYPEICPEAKKVSDWGSKTEFTVPRKGRGGEPTLMTAAVGKALASTHHDVIKASDVVTENNIHTPGQIQDVIDFFGYLESLRERFDGKCPTCKALIPKDGSCHGFIAEEALPNPGWKDVEGTLYSYADYYQKIVDYNATEPDPKPWKITKQSCWLDAKKTKPLWPERFPIAELHRIEHSPEVGPVLFASQYELEQVRAEDGLASPEDIKFFPAHIIGELLPRYRLFTAIDLASPLPGATGDFGVIMTAGIDTDARIDVLSVNRGHFTNDQLIALIFATDAVYQGKTHFKIQKDHFAHSLEPLLRREMAKRGRYISFELTPISNRESKAAKIKGLQGFFRMGLIRFADNISHKQDLIREIVRWPKGGNDDMLDALSDLFRTAKGRVSSAMWPDAPKGFFGMPVADNKFLGFDPISCEQRWLYDQIEAAHGEYSPMTGAL